MDTITSQTKETTYKYIKIAIWLYFLLWIFEGALRKWILPSLATPLLVVRDPLAIYIIVRALWLNVKFRNPYVILSSIFTILSLIATLTFGHGNLFVGLYGARIMLIHFPLIFIIGAVFTREDVLKMGRALLLLNILMTIIVYFQFTSPQTAFINIGLGGEGSSGFTGAKGYFRPSGTFSFTTGLSVFYTAVSVFVFYFWLSKDYCSKLLLSFSTIALVIALPLTISRGAVFAVVIVGLFAIIAAVTNAKTLIKVLITGIALYLVVIILQNYFSIFSLGTEVFMDRVDTANKHAGAGGGLKESMLSRMVNDTFGPILTLFNYPMFTGNLGLGTTAGAQLLTGKTTFLVSEFEVGRLIGEQGIILGGGILAVRIVLAFRIAIQSWTLPQEEKLLPFILCGAACVAIFQGQWSLPLILGYGIIIGGLVIASLKKEEDSVVNVKN